MRPLCHKRVTDTVKIFSTLAFRITGKANIVQDFREGKDPKKIADEKGISVSTVYRYVNEDQANSKGWTYRKLHSRLRKFGWKERSKIRDNEEKKKDRRLFDGHIKLKNNLQEQFFHEINDDGSFEERGLGINQERISDLIWEAIFQCDGLFTLPPKAALAYELCKSEVYYSYEGIAAGINNVYSEEDVHSKPISAKGAEKLLNDALNYIRECAQNILGVTIKPFS